MRASRGFWHTSFLLLLASLGGRLVIVGLLVLFDFPTRLEAWWLWVPLGIVGIAFGMLAKLRLEPAAPARTEESDDGD